MSSSSTQKTYEILRADVLAGRLRSGERLIIATLCEQLKVSSGAVREALSRLTSDRLVTMEPQRGFRVAPISSAELRDLTSVRVEIEMQCLTRSLANSDVAWEGRLLAAHHELSRVPARGPGMGEKSSEAFALPHGRFHFELVSACDSPWLLRLRALVYDQSERYRRLSAPLAAHRDVAQEHRDILEAALAHDEVRLRSLMREHLARTTEIILRSNLVETELNETPGGRRSRKRPWLADAGQPAPR